MRALLVVAALIGAAGVAFGAFGAHAAADERARTLLETGARYQLIHALAVFAAAHLAAQAPRAASASALLFIAGAVIFPGALYALALGAPRFFGAVAPVGGLCFIAGWVALAFAATR
jgi:uncharacterized membrane protein YgdD (TMEM256/DUF423 family)